jgi:pimeloyl-ACP methyl ester carboxylesterase
MWSDSRAEVLEAEGGARDLHAALRLAGESPPFLPVGYSRGAFNVLIFTDLFDAEVAAVIFLEPRHPVLEARRAQAGIRQGSEPPLALAKFGRALRWTGLPRVFGSYCEASWYSNEIVDTCKAYFPHSLDGIISEDSVMESVRSRAAEVVDLGNRPVLVLTRQLKDEWLGSDEVGRSEVQKSENHWRDLHAEMASWSSQGKQHIVPDSTHSLPYTHPQVVLDEVRDIINSVRQHTTISKSHLK